MREEYDMLRYLPDVSLALLIGLSSPVFASGPVYGGGWKEFKEMLTPSLEFEGGTVRPSIDLIDATEEATRRSSIQMRGNAGEEKYRHCVFPRNAFGEPLPAAAAMAMGYGSLERYCNEH